MRCQKCNTEVTQGEFCPECGSKVIADTAYQLNTPQPNSPQPNTYQPNTYQQNTSQPNSYQPNSYQPTQQQGYNQQGDEYSKPAMILGVLSIIFGIFIPILGAILGIVSIVKHKKSGSTKSIGIVLPIIGFIVSFISWLIAFASMV